MNVCTVQLLFGRTQATSFLGFFPLMHRQTISGQISSLFHFNPLTSDFFHPHWKGNSNFTPQVSIERANAVNSQS